MLECCETLAASSSASSSNFSDSSYSASSASSSSSSDNESSSTTTDGGCSAPSEQERRGWSRIRCNLEQKRSELRAALEEGDASPARLRTLRNRLSSSETRWRRVSERRRLLRDRRRLRQKVARVRAERDHLRSVLVQLETELRAEMQRLEKAMLEAPREPPVAAHWDAYVCDLKLESE